MYIFCLLWTTVWFSLSSFLLFCGWWVSQIALDFFVKDSRNSETKSNGPRATSSAGSRDSGSSSSYILLGELSGDEQQVV